MESIRARYAARINSTYTNENQTDIFKSLGLYNNDSTSLQASNNANATAGTTASAFISVRDPAATPWNASVLGLHNYRDHAWTDMQERMSNEDAWVTDAPAGYAVNPINLNVGRFLAVGKADNKKKKASK